MSLVNILNVSVLNNPSSFDSPFQFEVTFEVLSELKEDLEFKLIYVGSALSETSDQVLESLLVGPVPVGVNKFVMQADPPKRELLPASDVLGVTVVLLTCSYLNREFIRIGYYVNNEYVEEELKENPPEQIQFDKLSRSILADKPKVTRFQISWDPNVAEIVPNLPEGELNEEQTNVAAMELMAQD